jgi:hypothetical protein
MTLWKHKKQIMATTQEKYSHHKQTGEYIYKKWRGLIRVESQQGTVLKPVDK